MSEYKPLLDRVRPYLNIKFSEIPKDIREDIRARVKETNSFSLWDELTPWQREQLVDQYDCQHDPVRAEAVDEACNFYLKKEYLKHQINGLESMPARTPLERESKIRQLNELNKELEALESNHSQNSSKLKKIPITQQQEKAILNVLRKKGYDPLDLPKPPQGKAGVRKEVRDSCYPSEVFASEKVFNNKWQELLTEGTIKYAP